MADEWQKQARDEGAPSGGAATPQLPSGNDPLGALALRRNWDATLLGPIATWPGELRQAARLVFAAPAPAVVWWGDDFVQVYNEAARPLYGALDTIALGDAIAHAPLGGWQQLPSLLANVYTTGDAGSFEGWWVALTAPGGLEERCFAASLLPIHLENGAIGGVLGLLRDTTAQAARERDFAAMVARDEAKSALFADIGQEFVAPLSLLIAPLQELQSGEQGATRAQALATAQRAYLRLLKLISAFNQFARIGVGRTIPERQATDLAHFTTDLTSMFRPAIEAAGLRLVVDCPPLPWAVAVDRGMWEKIVLNLLSNAVKYTHRGEIAVTLGAVARVGGTDVALAVRDTGVGLAPDELAHLADPYRRVVGAHGRTREGAGLGLRLVREFARLHGGDLAIESARGRGSTFTVTIPTDGATEADELPSRAHPRAPTPYLQEARRWLSRDAALRRPSSSDEAALPPGAERVLIVAAPGEFRDYLQQLLAVRWAVAVVSDAAEAIAAARAAPPALIAIADASPAADGGTLVRELRDHAAALAAPILLLSGRADAEGTIAGLEAGADDVLAVPFVARDLLARVQSHTHLHRLRREAQAVREEFVAAAAHDLRTPLTSVQIGLSLLHNDAAGLSADARGVLDAVRRNAQRLAFHIDDLVTANQLSAEMLRLRREEVDLRAVVREALATVAPLFREKGQQVELALRRPLPYHGDARRLEQVFVNLLVNAHRYTPVRSRVRIAARRDARGILLTVRDKGPGIPDDEREQIFARHRRIQQGHGGSGLGLSIARRLIELHGGRIWAENDADGGAIFRIALPPSDDSDDYEEGACDS